MCVWGVVCFVVFGLVAMLVGLSALFLLLCCWVSLSCRLWLVDSVLFGGFVVSDGRGGSFAAFVAFFLGRRGVFETGFGVRVPELGSQVLFCMYFPPRVASQH